MRKGKNRKNIIAIAVLVVITNLITYAVFSGKQTVLSNKTAKTVVAELDGKEIKSDDIYLSWKEEGSAITAMDVILNEADEYILDDKFKDNKEVNKEVELQKEQQISYYESQNIVFDDLLEENNISKEDWETQIFYAVAREEVAKNYVKSIITDEQVKKAHSEDLPLYQSSHILFKITPEEGVAIEDIETAAYEKALIVSKDLNAAMEGAEDPEAVFAEFAKEHSEDLDSKDNGGDIGLSNSENVEYEAAARALAVGEHTLEPVKTNYGYELILKTNEQEPKDLEDSSVVDSYKDEIAATMLSETPSYTQMAMIKLREEYNFKIIDSVINDLYQTSIEDIDKAINGQ